MTFVQQHAAAFGRLCVETEMSEDIVMAAARAAAFGRLCVETHLKPLKMLMVVRSRLRAAVC